MLLNAVELGVMNTMLCAKLKKRRRFWRWAIVCTLLQLTYVFLVPLESLNYIVIHLPIILIASLYVGLCYELTLIQTLFICIAGYTVKHISSLLNSIITVFFPNTFAHFVGGSGGITALGYVLIIGIDAIVFTAAYFLIARRLGEAELQKNARLPIIILGALVLVMNQLWSVGLAIYGVNNTDSFNDLMGFVWNIICCFLTLAIEFNIFSISQKDRQLEITRGMIAEKERQYKLSKANIDAVNHKCHDLKYQLLALKNGNGGDRQIDEALELVDSLDSVVRTGNDTLDIIFTEKNQYCRKHRINFVCMIDGEKLNFMDPADQYVMFGNIIDNAINAVRRIPDYDLRSIYVNIRAEKALLLVQTENPFVGELDFRDGLPRTTTGDEFNHGYGMRSIRLIAEKYRGSVNTRAEDGIFYLNAVIPIVEQGEKA